MTLRARPCMWCISRKEHTDTDTAGYVHTAIQHWWWEAFEKDFRRFYPYFCCISSTVFFKRIIFFVFQNFLSESGVRRPDVGRRSDSDIPVRFRPPRLPEHPISGPAAKKYPSHPYLKCIIKCFYQFVFKFVQFLDFKFTYFLNYCWFCDFDPSNMAKMTLL